MTRGEFDRPRATVFGEAAERYDDSRPGYPVELVDRLLRTEPRLAVDVGCGTGIAARAFAARGVQVVGVEPDRRMAEVAMAHGLDVRISTLEDWEPERCDLLYAAQAWHWIDPTVGAARAEAAIRPGGQWAVFWNHDDDVAVAAVVAECYRRHAPHLIDEHLRPAGPIDSRISDAIGATGAFSLASEDVFHWVDQLTVARYVARRATYSGHRLLPPTLADELHADLRASLGGAEAVLLVRYTTQLMSATRQ